MKFQVGQRVRVVRRSNPEWCFYIEGDKGIVKAVDPVSLTMRYYVAFEIDNKVMNQWAYEDDLEALE